eukprot:3026306-Prymnesium_polylepis.1
MLSCAVRRRLQRHATPGGGGRGAPPAPRSACISAGPMCVSASSLAGGTRRSCWTAPPAAAASSPWPA